MFLIWCYVLLSLRFTCLFIPERNICTGLLSWPSYFIYFGNTWTKLKTSFAINLRNLSLFQFYHSSISGIKLGTVEVLFACVSSESFSLQYSVPGASSFWIWLCGSWLLMELTLNWEKACSTESPYGSNFVLFKFTKPYH